MAITIVKAPQAIVPIKNDVWIEAETDQVGGKFNVTVYYWNAPIGTVIATTTYSVDVNNRVKFNLKSIIQALGAPASPFGADIPTFNQNTISEATRCIKEWFIWLDDYNASGSHVSNHPIVGLKAVLAGISFEKFTTANAYTSFIGTGSTLRKFLTNRSLTKKIFRNQQEFLYYLHTDAYFGAGISMSLKVKMYWTDGSTPLEITLFNPVIEVAKISIIPTGFTQLNLASHEVANGKIISKYEVYLHSTTPSAGNVTSIYTYEVEQAVCNTDSRYFLFLNSLGGMDTLYCRVIDEYQVAIESAQAERFLQDGYSVTDGQFFEFEKKATRKFKCQTGLVTKAERVYMREFFLSTKVLEIASNQYLPVRITNSSIQLHKGEADLQSITFDYEYAFEDHAY